MFTELIQNNTDISDMLSRKLSDITVADLFNLIDAIVEKQYRPKTDPIMVNLCELIFGPPNDTPTRTKTRAYNSLTRYGRIPECYYDRKNDLIVDLEGFAKWISSRSTRNNLRNFGDGAYLMLKKNMEKYGVYA